MTSYNVAHIKMRLQEDFDKITSETQNKMLLKNSKARQWTQSPPWMMHFSTSSLHRPLSQRCREFRGWCLNWLANLGSWTVHLPGWGFVNKLPLLRLLPAGSSLFLSVSYHHSGGEQERKKARGLISWSGQRWRAQRERGEWNSPSPILAAIQSTLLAEKGDL